MTSRTPAAAFEQRQAVVLGDREAELATVGRDHPAGLEVDRQRRAPAGLLDLARERLDGRIVELDGEHAVLEAVRVEDEAEARRDHGAETEVAQRPDRRLARAAACEVAAGEQDGGVPVRLSVEHEGGVLGAVAAGALRVAPAGEQALAEAGLGDLQQLRAGNDAVGVDVHAEQRRGNPGMHAEGRRHASTFRTSEMHAFTADSATVAGLARNEVTPRPWRFSKFRLVDEITRRAAPKVSPLAPALMQSEQPDSRHSKPASLKMRSMPSASA